VKQITSCGISFGHDRPERADQIGIIRYGLIELWDDAAMKQQLPSWRTAKGQTLWLAILIETMEKFSRPEWRARPVSRLELAAALARLAQPATAYASRFSLRN
jgi:hypothetical protein